MKFSEAIANAEGSTVVFTTSTSDPELMEFLADDFNFEMCLRKLSLRDQLKVRNAKHNRNKALLLRLFATVVLNRCLGPGGELEPWKQIEYHFNEFGKPTLKNLEFNSSSSNDLASIVVQLNSSSPVGIDLSHEQQDAVSSETFMDQFGPIFEATEVEQLLKISDTDRRYIIFNQFWTLKESFTKYLGCGLNIDLSRFSFQLSEEPLSFQDLIPVFEGECKGYTVNWQQGTQVIYEKLLEYSIPSEVYCFSGVLRNGALPVMISVISELKEIPQTVHLNILAFLKADLSRVQVTSSA